MEHREAAAAPISVYREFAPCAELRAYVRALAWFGPTGETAGSRAPMREFYVGADDALTPSFADAHTSLLFSLPFAYSNNRWRSSSVADATAMGAVTRATQPPGGERSAMIGVYLRPRGGVALLGASATELTDRIVSLSDLWKGFAMPEDQASLESVETMLARRLSVSSSPGRALQIAELASHVRRLGGRVSVAQMADLAGVSRQHLRRLFLQHVGVGPDLYARLARFRTGLGYVGEQRADGWSRLAARLGYADQSHLIAEFREFTSYTPEQLVHGNRFHPFIGDDGGARPE